MRIRRVESSRSSTGTTDEYGLSRIGRKYVPEIGWRHVFGSANVVQEVDDAAFADRGVRCVAVVAVLVRQHARSDGFAVGHYVGRGVGGAAARRPVAGGECYLRDDDGTDGAAARSGVRLSEVDRRESAGDRADDPRLVRLGETSGLARGRSEHVAGDFSQQ